MQISRSSHFEKTPRRKKEKHHKGKLSSLSAHREFGNKKPRFDTKEKQS